jgi:F-type H+-transporting ATPase subunit gamma
MGSLIGIRRRIKSAKNIAQITKAMEMVSASKMKKAQEAALSTRPFTDKLKEIMSKVGSGSSVSHPLLTTNQSKSIMVVLISTNKGLCGGLNVNLYRGLLDFVKENQDSKIKIVTVGKKAKWVTPGTSAQLVAKFNDLGEAVTFVETRSISSYLMQEFKEGTVGKVFLAYPKFISTLQNEITFIQLLPLQNEEYATSADYTIEPSPSALLDSLLPYQIEMTLYQTILESRATEHSARMVAMKNASDNARDLISSLTLDYNQARQSAVTSELLDVTTARMALVE